MTTPRTDIDPAAARAAADGQAALSAGDTARAGDRFGEAGRMLEARLPALLKPEARNAVRFQAAQQYFRGGHYAKALSLARKVEGRLLAPEDRRRLDTFFREVKERAAPEYLQTTQERLLALWKKNDYRAILAMLQDHPFMMPPGALAFCRGNCCEELKDHRTASLHYADAMKGMPEDPVVVYSAATHPLALAREGNLADAVTFAEAQLRQAPTAVTRITASVLRLHQAAKAPAGERRSLLDRQRREQEEAWDSFPQLPPPLRDYPAFRSLLVFCLEASAFGLAWAGERQQAVEVCGTAVAYAPHAPGPRTARGILTYPAPEAADDFREAVNLGEPAYHPYFYLAHAALAAGDLPAASNWHRRTVAHRPPRSLESRLASWAAFLAAHAGKDAAEAAGLVREAGYLGLEKTGTPLDPETMNRETEWLDYLAARESQILSQRSALG